MKALKFSLMLMLLAFCLPMTSCGDDDDDAPSLGSVTVKNESTYSYGSFTVIFTTEDCEELISSRDFGTLSPNASVTAEIPSGAEEYYFRMVVGGDRYVSASYKVSTKFVKITNDTLWY